MLSAFSQAVAQRKKISVKFITGREPKGNYFDDLLLFQ